MARMNPRVNSNWPSTFLLGFNCSNVDLHTQMNKYQIYDVEREQPHLSPWCLPRFVGHKSSDGRLRLLRYWSFFGVCLKFFSSGPFQYLGSVIPGGHSSVEDKC